MIHAGALDVGQQLSGGIFVSNSRICPFCDLSLLVVLAACQQSVFVGMAPQVVDHKTLTATAASPVPEFGPSRSLKRVR